MLQQIAVMPFLISLKTDFKRPPHSVTRPACMWGDSEPLGSGKIPHTPHINRVGFVYLHRRDAALRHSLVCFPLCLRAERSTISVFAKSEVLRILIENSFLSSTNSYVSFINILVLFENEVHPKNSQFCLDVHVFYLPFKKFSFRSFLKSKSLHR